MPEIPTFRMYVWKEGGSFPIQKFILQFSLYYERANVDVSPSCLVLEKPGDPETRQRPVRYQCFAASTRLEKHWRESVPCWR